MSTNWHNDPHKYKARLNAAVPDQCECGRLEAAATHKAHTVTATDMPVNGVTRADELNALNKAPGSSHYQDFAGPQPIEVTRHMDFLRGNAVKYLMRAGRKGGTEGERLDLEKAIQYATWALEKATHEDESRSGNES